MIIIIVFLLSVVFVLISFSLGCLTQRQNIADENLDSNDNGEGVQLKFTLLSHKSKMEIDKAILVANTYHKKKIGLSRGNTVEETLMEEFGTNDITGFYLDCVQGTLTINIVLLLQQCFPKLKTFWNKFHLELLIELGYSIIFLFLRYLDLSKDLLLLYIIWLQLGNYGSLSFPIAVFWIFFSAILATEIANFFTISLEGNLNGKLVRKAFYVICNLLFTPLMPAFHIHKYIALLFVLDNHP